MDGPISKCTLSIFCSIQCCCVYEIGATTADLPPGVLYRVKATYKYVKEDADELSFEVGETINVIEYDDPDDQVNVITSLAFA